MPVKDLPEIYDMDPRASAHVEHHAPAMREHLAGLLGGLESLGVESNDRVSFATEVLAAQVNVVVDQLRQRAAQTNRADVGDSDLTNIVVSDIMNRALLRRLRGDDA